MKYLQTGIFFGETSRTVKLDGITLTDTDETRKTENTDFLIFRFSSPVFRFD